MGVAHASLAAVLGLTVGAAIGWSLAKGSASEPRVSDSPPSPAVRLEVGDERVGVSHSELAQIREMLEKLLERESASNRGERTAPDDPTLREIAELLRARSSQPASSDSVEERTQRLRELYDAEPSDPQARASLWDSFQPPDRDRKLTEHHRFWSYEDVLRSYGRPNTITPLEGQAVWAYERTGSQAVQFRFLDGRVSNVW